MSKYSRNANAVLTIIVAQGVSWRNLVRSWGVVASVDGDSGSLIRSWVPVIGERKNHKEAVLLRKFNDSVQFLKAVGTIIDNCRPIGYQLEPSTICRYCVYI